MSRVLVCRPSCGRRKPLRQALAELHTVEKTEMTGRQGYVGARFGTLFSCPPGMALRSGADCSAPGIYPCPLRGSRPTRKAG
eukprot:7170436-Prymnesium_polylepis.1